MVDRYTIIANNNELALVLGVDVPETFEPQFNAAPTKKLPVLTSSDQQNIQFFHWGLISKLSNNRSMSTKLFNLQIDAALERPNYINRIKSNRCIIPMDGFYIWKKVAKKKVVPHYFYFKDHRVFAVPAIWESDDENNASFNMITTESIQQLRSFQENMPLIMDVSTAKKWLKTGDLEILKTTKVNQKTENLISKTVSPKIGNLDFNDNTLIETTPPVDQYGNYTLFT